MKRSSCGERCTVVEARQLDAYRDRVIRRGSEADARYFLVLSQEEVSSTGRVRELNAESAREVMGEPPPGGVFY